jgi:uncharacterized integral membrane protein
MTSTPPERPAAEPAPEPTDTQPDTRADTAGAPVDPLRASRTSGAWIGLAVVAVLLVLLIIFIAQNTQKVEVSFLGWNGHTPLAVAILASVVTGLVVAAITGTLRIVQLRRRVKRSNR